jgi:NADH:ubiquinone oxidoreductase subunit 4 (subunit M)
MILNLILGLLFLGSLLVLVLPYSFFRKIRIFGFFITISVYLVVLGLWVYVIDVKRAGTQILWVYFFKTQYNVCWSVSLDGISFCFLILTSFIFIFCFLSV